MRAIPAVVVASGLALAATITDLSPTKAAPVDEAFRLCAIIDSSGLATECEVNGWESTVDFRIDTSSGEARKMCAGLVEMMAEQGRSFDGRWKLRVFSPYSGDHPIAVCTLR